MARGRRRGGRSALQFGTLRGTIAMLIVATVFFFMSIVGRFSFFSGRPSMFMQIPFYITAILFYALALMSYIKYRKNTSVSQTTDVCTSERSQISRHSVSYSAHVQTISSNHHQHTEQAWDYSSTHRNSSATFQPFPQNPGPPMNYQGGLNPINNMRSTQIPTQHQNRSGMFPTTFEPTPSSIIGGQQPGYAAQPTGTTFDPNASSAMGMGGQQPSHSQDDLPPSYDEVIKNDAARQGVHHLFH